MDFDELKIAKAYVQARKLNPAAVQIWQAAILKYVNPSSIHQILDLGCGTGRFLPFLGELFPGAEIVGVDPAHDMLSEAKEFYGDRYRLLAGSAENLPLPDESQDLVFMCMAYHALENKHKAAGEIRRVLKSGGVVVIKQVVKEANRQHSFFDFFPEALPIAQNLVPARQEIIREFSEQGFVLRANELISYERAKNWDKYFETIKYRGISVLKLLPDAVFSQDLERFRKFCQEHASKGPVVDSRDLFVFQKPLVSR